MGSHRIYIILLSCIIGATACVDPDRKNKSEGAISRAFDQYLYLDDIEELHVGMNPADSINMVNNVIDNWLTEQLMSETARTHLPITTKKEIEDKVESYRHELYRFAYEKEIVRQKMDTTVHDTVISNYFDAYIKNYQLDEAYLRFIYVRCDKEEFVEEVEGWMIDSIDLYNLEDFCSEELQVCHLHPNKWISIRNFYDKLSEIEVDSKKVSNGNSFIKIKNENLHYLIRVLEFKDQGESAPLTFVEDDIRSILLNKKKSEFLNAFQRDLISTETVKGNVKIYDNGED